MLLSLAIANLKRCSGPCFDTFGGEKNLGSIGEENADEHGSDDIQKVMMCANAKSMFVKKFFMMATPPPSSSLGGRKTYYVLTTCRPPSLGSCF